MKETDLIKRSTSKYKENFLITSNSLAQNVNVSFQSKGMLMLLLSLPDDWIIHKSWVMKEYKVGRDRLNRIFKELTDSGYLICLDMVRKNGKFMGKNYVIYDTPQNGVLEDSPMYRLPYTVKPSTVKPSTVNSTTTKNIYLQSKKNKKEKITQKENSVFSVINEEVVSNGSFPSLPH